MPMKNTNTEKYALKDTNEKQHWKYALKDINEKHQHWKNA